MQPGDMALAEWTAKEEADDMEDAEFMVQAIVDDRKIGRRREFLVKWQVHALRRPFAMTHHLFGNVAEVTKGIQFSNARL